MNSAASERSFIQAVQMRILSHIKCNTYICYSIPVLVGVAWSIEDPWTFASLSYDGRVSVHQVPSQTKYKILI